MVADGWPAADDAPAATGAVRLQWERTRGGWRRSEQSGIDGDRRSGDETLTEPTLSLTLTVPTAWDDIAELSACDKGDCLSGVWDHAVPSVGKERACGVSPTGEWAAYGAGRHELG